MRTVLLFTCMCLMMAKADGQDPDWQYVNFPFRFGDSKMSADPDTANDVVYLTGDYFPLCDSDSITIDCQEETLASFNGHTYQTYGRFHGEIRDVVRFQGHLYAAGFFDYVNDDIDSTKRYIVRRDSDEWVSVGTVNSEVSGMTADSNYLYICGIFTQINGQPIKYVARYDGTHWQGFPDAYNEIPTMYQVRLYQGNLYVGGYFTYGSNIQNLMYFQDGAWHPVGDNPEVYGTNVTRLTVWHNELYIQGDYFTSSSAIHNHLLKWDGQTLSAPWPTFYDPNHQSASYGSGFIWMVPTTNYLYVCGSAKYIGNTQINYVARYDGTQFCGMHTQDVIYPTSGLFAYHDSIYAYNVYESTFYNPPSGLYKWIGGDDVGPCSEAVTGTEEVLYRKLSVHPNPTHNEIYVDNLHGLINYHLYDLLGRMVKEGKTSCSGQFRIDLTGITTGTYLLHIDGKTVNYSTQVVKE